MNNYTLRRMAEAIPAPRRRVLSAEQQVIVRRWYKSGRWTQAQLAARFDVSRESVNRLLRRKQLKA